MLARLEVFEDFSYPGICTTEVETAKNRNEEMSKIMDEILNCVNSGKEFHKTWVKYDSTVEKLLELGYTLSSTETMESYFKNNHGGGNIWGSYKDQITISW